MSKIFLKSYIHSKSFEQLFDYKSDFHTHQTFFIDKNMSFYKNKNFLKAKPLKENETFLPLFNNQEFIFGIEKILENNKPFYFFVKKNNNSFHEYRLNSRNKKRENPFFISLYNFNYTKNDLNIKERKRKNDLFKHYKNYFELNIGDVIKLGRMSLILTKIHLEQNINNNLARCETYIETKLNKKENKDIKYNKREESIYNKNNHLIKSRHKLQKNYEKIITNTKGDNDEKQEEIKSNSEKNNICRICFMSESDTNSPLLSLCNCSGDSKFIHLNCLSEWIKVKSEIVHTNKNIYKKIIFNTINCEICTQKFPEMVYDIKTGKSYEIYNPDFFITSLNSIYHNYVIFESFEIINNKKIILIISFDTKDKITVGRSQSCDVKIFDETISRIHSILLRTKDNKIMIKDCCSKFGTLILLHSNKILIKDKILSIQKGKILLNLYLEYYKLNYIFNNLFNLLFCCLNCNKKKKENKNISCANKNSNSNNKKNLDDSNFNMVMINNFINIKEGTNLDYNIINKNNINIEEIIDIRFNADNNEIKVEE